MYEFLVILCYWLDRTKETYDYREIKCVCDTMTEAHKKTDVYIEDHGLDIRGIDIYRMGRV